MTIKEISYSDKDATQVTMAEHDRDKIAKRVLTYSPLVPEDYDEIELSYIDPAAVDPLLEFVTYKKNTQTVAVLELAYDASDNLINVKRI